MTRHLSAFCLLTVAFIAVSAEHAFSAEGVMIRVTADNAPIKLDNTVLATVKRGTRLWVFEVKDDGWAQVKVPGRNQKGWMYYKDIEVIKLSEADKARLKEAYAHYDRYLKLERNQRFVEALTALKACLVTERQVRGADHPETAITLNNLGNLTSVLGDYAAARKYFDEALAIRRKVFDDEHTDTAITLNNLGNLTRDLGDYAAARKYYEESLAIFRKVHGDEHPHTAGSLANLAWLGVDFDDLTGASDYLEQARRVIRYHEARLLPTLSEREQLSFLQNNHEYPWTMSLSFGLAQRDDVQIVNLSAGWLINGKAVTQEALSEGALLAGPETAPLVNRLRRVRSQLSRLAMQPAAKRSSQELARLKAEQEQLVRELGRARGKDLTQDPWIEVDSVRQALPAEGLMINIVRLRPYDFKAGRRADARYVAWLIPADGQRRIEIVDLGEAKPIDRAVAAFRQAMDRANTLLALKGEAAASAELDKTLKTLAELVWKPFSAHVGQAEELIISPDGALWLVPWAALPAGDNKFLLEDYKIRYVISGRELVERRSDSKTPTRPVVIADPDYDLKPQSGSQPADSRTLARRSVTRLGHAGRLSETAREAREIEPSLAKLGSGKPVLYLDHQATEQQFKKLQSPRVLVLSTHGFLLEDQQVEVKDEDRLLLSNQDQPKTVLTTDGKPLENPLLRCGLLLAGCNQAASADAARVDDGILTGLEIVGTDLRGTEMAVLSACETGVGEVRSGEGVAGLRQAFQLAGVETVVATLWKIPSNETVKLMNDFFIFWSNGQSKSEALQNAQLARIQAHRNQHGAAHPFYWAAFTITGRD